MKTKDIIEGLLILEKYRDNVDGYNTGAEHDELFAYPTDRPVEQPDLDRLIELGWRQYGADIDEDEEFSAKHYDIEESWQCFV